MMIDSKQKTDCKNLISGDKPKCKIFDFSFCLGSMCNYYNEDQESQKVKDFKYIYDIVHGQQVNFFN